MKTFTITQWVVIIILALLTALEPLSIDLYLPGFIQIAETLNTTTANVQISLSTFLGGFAIGQLLWGPLADKFGRKKPILLSLAIFIIATVACIYVRNIEQLWIARFIQAIGGCGGVVISRAVVTDYFKKSETLKIYSILALIMGIAPIIAPVMGNGILTLFSWKALFGVILILGIGMFIFTLFGLPETHRPVITSSVNKTNILQDYWSVLRVKKFFIYSLIAGIANGALMVYVANGPFLIMEKGGLSNNAFSVIFAVNAFGLMLASYLTTYLQKHIPVNKLVKLAVSFMFVVSIILLLLMYMNANIYFILVCLFFFVFPIGILFPTTTDLAITPFSDNSGTASALFGSIQLLVAFICSIISSVMSDGSVVAVGIAFLLCTLAAFIVLFFRVEPRQELAKETVKRME
ncbi:multidrug effflux MFS transporter [Bacteroides sp. 224]|uniref:multidrug effflux MFS transporter n=1 Tax=Bacteroides sp. 224 TaxID=2302936 RepID=UPI0013D3FB0D|nr:multidrug effflux MFS transporter [Bacteroides sp. 224]NDV67104.1 Bcr/CflA family efflux MFS transporter [Bacteroides sp. 224]